MKNEQNKSLEPDDAPVDLSAVRAKLASKQGQQYWRSLEEVVETPEFQQFLQDEFPNRSTLLQMDRRSFLSVMGASLALAGLSGCRFLPQEKILPYVRDPEEIVLGRPLMYATSATIAGSGIGLLVESREGRPIKIEGNPDHPASLGATNSFAQAEMLAFYDPDRAQNVTRLGQPGNWESFLAEARTTLEAMRPAGGAGVRLLTDTVISPSLAEEIEGFLREFPQARWHQYDPIGGHGARAGAQMAFGAPVNPVYRFREAAVILSLDSDFIYSMPGHVRYAREFADGRRTRIERPEMNRLYAVDSSPSLTGSTADHRLAVRPSEVENVARTIADRFGVAGAAPGPLPEAVPAAWINALVADLQGAGPRALVVPGHEQTPAVHALAHAINQALGAVGTTVVYTDPLEANPVDQIASLRDLANDLEAGAVQALFIMGGNPAYSAPVDFNFAERLRTYSTTHFSACLSRYFDETAALCRWHVPESHFLEAWGDTLAYDGTASITQPLIEPLYNTRSAYEFVSALRGRPRSGYDIVRDYWRRRNLAPNFDAFWERTLNEGVVRGTALPPRAAAAGGAGIPPLAAQPAAANDALEIAFRPDPTIWDGRYSNNGWLQELPKAMTTLTWDNAAIISPRTAERLRLRQGDRVEVVLRERAVEAPVWIQPGHSHDTITVHLGYGRTRAGQVGNGVGFDAYAIRPSDAAGWSGDVTVRRVRGRHRFAVTQLHHSMEGRDIVRATTLTDFTARGGDLTPGGHHSVDPRGDVRHQQDPGPVPSTGVDRPPDVPHGAGTMHPDSPLLDTDTRELQDVVRRGPTVTADPHRREWRYIDENPNERPGYPSMFPNFDYQQNYAWGMVIDQNVCNGCNVCTIACQAENNIPVVGKNEVARGREMHWIRVDRYYVGPDVDAPDTVYQPMLCVHCEKAPCEPVCPVAATVHSREGLNMMVYNRCIGTRYCSNNCPYKVRRFNFLNYANHHDQPLLKMLNNPEVTVRGRGVMEKCTYCVQRINAARIEAKKGDRAIQDGEVVPACAQACPTQAIVFGDLNDPNSRVVRLKLQPQNYSVLAELLTQPRTTYLPKLWNPNPALAAATPGVEATIHGH